MKYFRAPFDPDSVRLQYTQLKAQPHTADQLKEIDQELHDIVNIAKDAMEWSFARRMNKKRPVKTVKLIRKAAPVKITKLVIDPDKALGALDKLFTIINRHR
jgi:hypothetical protein